MLAVIWIVLGIIVLTTILFAIAMSLKKKENRKPDYYAFYIIGITWLAIGLPLKNYGLFLMGLIFSIVGIVNKDKWKKNRQDWKKLSHKEKNFRMFLIIIFGIILLIGIVFYFIVRNGILLY